MRIEDFIGMFFCIGVLVTVFGLCFSIICISNYTVGGGYDENGLTLKNCFIFSFIIQIGIYEEIKDKFSLWGISMTETIVTMFFIGANLAILSFCLLWYTVTLIFKLYCFICMNKSGRC